MKKALSVLGYILAFFAGAALATGLFLGPWAIDSGEYTKLEQLQDLIEEQFIGEADPVAMGDAAAAAMVDSLGDRWTYYLSAEDFNLHLQQVANEFVGVGITITVREDGELEVMKVSQGSPAQEAGIQVGDILTHANGQSCSEAGLEGTGTIVRGEEGTTVELTLRRGNETLVLNVERRRFELPVATWQLLEGNVGLIKIENFDERCADETLAAIDAAIAAGADRLLFDLRNNPGGYKKEMVAILDYLLPEGILFRSVRYDGKEETDTSDADFLDLPMAVLVNSESYSAAEFFAAALREYGVAQVIGEQTVGKGYFQYTYQLQDGSGVGLSVGKYFTPDGVSLAEAGGLTPDVEVEVDEETFALIYYDNLDPMEDPQVLAALDVLNP